MKTIFHFTIILLVIAIAARGIYLIVENTSVTSSGAPSEGQPTGLNGQMPSPPAGDGPEGGEHGGSFAGGISEVLFLLAKIAGITLIVTLIEKATDFFQKSQPILTKS
jgi:hypothetical protein